MLLRDKLQVKVRGYNVGKNCSVQPGQPVSKQIG